MKQTQAESNYKETQRLLELLGGSKYEWTEDDIEIEAPEK